MTNDNEPEDIFGGTAWLKAFMRLGGTVGLGNGDPALTLPLHLEEGSPAAQSLAALVTLGVSSPDKRRAIRQAALSMLPNMKGDR